MKRVRGSPPATALVSHLADERRAIEICSRFGGHAMGVQPLEVQRRADHPLRDELGDSLATAGEGRILARKRPISSLGRLFFASATE